MATDISGFFNTPRFEPHLDHGLGRGSLDEGNIGGLEVAHLDDQCCSLILRIFAPYCCDHRYDCACHHGDAGQNTGQSIPFTPDHPGAPCGYGRPSLA